MKRLSDFKEYQREGQRIRYILARSTNGLVIPAGTIQEIERVSDWLVTTKACGPYVGCGHAKYDEGLFWEVVC